MYTYFASVGAIEIRSLRLRLRYTAPQFFHSKQKQRSSTNPILIHHLLPSSLPVSTPSTVYHSRLTVCLPDSGFDPLPIDFVWNKRLWIIWFPRLCDITFVGAAEIS